MRILEHEKYMKTAIELANQALLIGEIPVGAVVVCNDEIIACACNEVEKTKLATRHAEIAALEKAAHALNSRTLSGCTLYTTLEPCGMCSGAIANFRIGTVVFGAYDEQYGAVFSKLNLPMLMGQNVRCIGGVLEDECKELLETCFLVMRK